MPEVSALVETLENRWMRAWIGDDLRTLKALTASDFRMVVGAGSTVILDAKSWLEAAGRRFECSGYRFGDIYARPVGNLIIFATAVEMKARLDGEDWSGTFWTTDLWRKSKLRRKWRMVERVLSRPEPRAQVPDAIQSMQLWRRQRA